MRDRFATTCASPVVHLYANIITVIALLGSITVSGNAGAQNVPDNDRAETPAAVDGARYGAIAFSRTTLRWHMRWNVTSADRASVLAIEKCIAADCRVVLTFGPGQCGTFSLGDQDALGVGRGKTSAIAHDTALNGCTDSGQTCKVAPVQCND